MRNSNRNSVFMSNFQDHRTEAILVNMYYFVFRMRGKKTIKCLLVVDTPWYKSGQAVNFPAKCLNLVIVSSSLIEKLAPAKAKLLKIRFLPGILYMLQVLLFVASQLASVFLQAQEYLTDHLTLTVLNMLPTLLMRALIAVLVFTLPAVLLENDLPVFKTKTAPQTDDPAASAVSTDK